MPRTNPFEEFTFRNLAQALASGLDPAYAQGIYNATIAQAQARRMQQQETLLGLQQMAYEQAASGIPESSAVGFIEAMSGAYPFLQGQNPYSLRQQAVLDDTFAALYPDPVAQQNPLLAAGATPSELSGGGVLNPPPPDQEFPIGAIARGISNFLPDFMPGSQLSELEAFAPQVGQALDTAQLPLESGPAPAAPTQIPSMAGTQPVMGADGLSPLYTVPRDQAMEAAAQAAALENQQALALAQGQGQIGLGLEAQGLPLEIQRAQALGQVDLGLQQQGMMQQAILEQQLPGMLGPQPLSEEERSSIGQLVSQRVTEGLSLPEIRQELMGLTVGMDPVRAQEAEQFVVQAWTQLTGATQAESTQLTKLFQAALQNIGGLQGQAVAGLTQQLGIGSTAQLAQRLAGIVAANPELKQQLPQLLKMLQTDFASGQAIGAILNYGKVTPQQQPQMGP